MVRVSPRWRTQICPWKHPSIQRVLNGAPCSLEFASSSSKSKGSHLPSICHFILSLLEIQGLGPNVLGVWPAGARCLGLCNFWLTSSLHTPPADGGGGFPLRQQLCFSQGLRVSDLTTAKCISLDAICLQFVNPAGKRSPDAWQTLWLYLVPESCLFINESRFGPQRRPRTHPPNVPDLGRQVVFKNKRISFLVFW